MEDKSKKMVSICSIKSDVDFSEELGISQEEAEEIETILRQCLQETSLSKAVKTFEMLLKAKGISKIKRKNREDTIRKCLIRSIWKIKSGFLMGELYQMQEGVEESEEGFSPSADKTNMYR